MIHIICFPAGCLVRASHSIAVDSLNLSVCWHCHLKSQKSELSTVVGSFNVAIVCLVVKFMYTVVVSVPCYINLLGDNRLRAASGYNLAFLHVNVHYYALPPFK